MESATLTREAAAGILRDLEQAEADRIQLADLSRRIGWSYAQQSKAISTGALEAERLETDRRYPYVITQDEALTLLLAAVLAVAAGIAIVAALRGLKGAGVTGQLAADVLHATVPT
jgi:hypothetical protein